MLFSRQNLIVLGLLPILFFYSYYSNRWPIGCWEAIELISAYASEQISLFFRISQRANLASQGHGFLEFPRIFFSSTSLSFDLIRTPTVFFGVLSFGLAFLFYQRTLSQTSALLAALVLFFNPVFQFFQQQVLILVPTIAFTFFYLNSFAKFFREGSKLSIFLFAISGAVLALGYAFGRYILFFSFLLVLGILFFHMRSTRNPKILKRTGVSFILFVIFLAIFDWKNPWRFLNLPEFLFPDAGDEIQGISPELLPTIWINLKYLFSVLFLEDKTIPYLHGLLSGVFLRPAPILLSLLSIGGIGLFLFHFFIEKQHKIENFLLVIILGVTCCLPLFSDVVGKSYTFSPFRIFMMVIPITYFSFYFLEKLRIPQIAIISFAIGLIGFQIYFFQSDTNEFHKKVESKNYSWEQDYGELFQAEWGSYHMNQYQWYWNMISEVKKQKKAGVNLVYFNVTNLHRKYPHPHSAPLHRFDNHTTLLSLYLVEAGLRPAPVMKYRETMDSISSKDFDGEVRKLPSALSIENGELSYQSKKPFFINQRFSKDHDVIFAVTKKGLEFGREYLKKNNLSYHYIQVE